MFVRDCMTSNPTTVRPDSDPVAASMVLKYCDFWHLPVVNDDGAVVGIVDGADLEQFLAGAGSPGVIKRQHRVEQAITREVVTVPPGCPLETAASLMVEHKVRSLPVVEGTKLVGIITEADIFQQFVAVLGGGRGSLRMTVQVADTVGQLAELAGRIAQVQGNITSLVTYPAGSTGRTNLMLRVEGADRETVLDAISDLPGVDLVHVWGCEGK